MIGWTKQIQHARRHNLVYRCLSLRGQQGTVVVHVTLMLTQICGVMLLPIIVLSQDGVISILITDDDLDVSSNFAQLCHQVVFIKSIR